MEGDCTICLCPTARTRQTKVLTCGHKFHRKCIDQWSQTHETCPTCRYDFSKPEYTFTITIKNKKNNEQIVLENQNIDLNIIEQLGVGPNFSTVQVEMNTYSLEELHEIMTDFGVLGSVDINSLVFNTE